MLLLYIIGFILIITTVIGIHELGHYLLARKAKIYCHEFSIGMGPVLWAKDTKTIRYSVKLFPIGGSVNISGEENSFTYLTKGKSAGFVIENDRIKEIVLTNAYQEKDYTVAKVIDFDLSGENNEQFVLVKLDSNELHKFHFTADATIILDDNKIFRKGQTRKHKIVHYSDQFQSKTIWQRFSTIFAGPFFNLCLGFILFFIISLIQGVPTNENIVGDLSQNSAAYTYGIRENDVIENISFNNNDYEIKSWNDIEEALASYSYEYTTLTIRYIDTKNNNTKTTVFTPKIYLPSIGAISNLNTTTDTVIGDVDGGRPAYDAGIRSGDKILKIGVGENALQDVSNWLEVTNLVKSNIADKENNKVMQSFTFVILRGDTEKEITFKPYKAIDEEQTYMSITGIVPLKEFKPHISFLNGFKGIKTVVWQVKESINLLLFDDNVGISDLSGPVGIYDVTRTFLHAGVVSILFWIAFLSINIGLMNLLPIPALDGGRLVFLGVEAITRKKVSTKVENFVHLLGFVLLLSVILYITGNDILRLIK